MLLTLLTIQTSTNQVNQMSKIKYIAAVVIAIAGLGLQQAKADIINFNLTGSNIGFTGNLISVTVNRTSTTSSTITFNSLTSGGHTFLMQSMGAAAVNVNASSWSIGSFTHIDAVTVFGGNGFITQTGVTDGGAGNEDGFGSFNQNVNANDGTAQSMTQISFTLTNLSGTWSSAANVLTGNSQGLLAAAHIVVFNAGMVFNGAQIATGFASGNGTSVPDGGTTAMLLGAAFGALGMARRFLKI
jgi:hypothetical protein